MPEAERPVPDFDVAAHYAVQCRSGTFADRAECARMERTEGFFRRKLEDKLSSASTREKQQAFDALCANAQGGPYPPPRDGKLGFTMRCQLLSAQGAKAPSPASSSDFAVGFFLFIIAMLVILRGQKAPRWSYFALPFLLFWVNAALTLATVVFAFGLLGLPAAWFSGAKGALVMKGAMGLALFLSYGVPAALCWLALKVFKIALPRGRAALLIAAFAICSNPVAAILIRNNLPVSPQASPLRIPLAGEDREPALFLQRAEKEHPELLDSIEQRIQSAGHRDPLVEKSLRAFSSLLDEIVSHPRPSAALVDAWKRKSAIIAGCIQSRFDIQVDAGLVVTPVWEEKKLTPAQKEIYRTYLRATGVFPGESVDQPFLPNGAGAPGCTALE